MDFIALFIQTTSRFSRQLSGVTIKHVEAVKNPFDVVRLRYVQGPCLAISCDGETNKMISWGTMHVKILIQIFDDGFDYIAVVAADKTIVYPDDDCQEFSLKMAQIETRIGNAWEKAKFLKESVKSLVPNCKLEKPVSGRKGIRAGDIQNPPDQI